MGNGFLVATEKFLAFTAQIDEEAREQQALIRRVQQQLSEQANEYKSVDSRLDALFTLAQTLGGFLESIPSETESAELFNSLDQRILALTNVLDDAPDKAQSQVLLTQLISDVANLKAYNRQQYSLEKLQHQTNDVTQARQATVAQSQAMVTAAQTITQILAEIETITHALNQDAKQVSDMLWGDLQRSDMFMSDIGQAPSPQAPQSSLGMDDDFTPNASPDDDLRSLDTAIAELSSDTGLELNEDVWTSNSANRPTDTSTPEGT
ncbi:MAG: hypothetical protein AAFX51_14015 [Cyanobacteria bacterium J06636_28]